MSRPIDVDAYEAGVLAGDRAMLGRAITLVESSLTAHHEQAQELLLRLGPRAGNGIRVGITGVPGVGKSTFIEALGTMLTTRGHKVAVLAVDPSSSRTGGSILGDKTRMAKLSVDPNAFIRPSPTAGTLGGVASATREAIVIVEAAGYDVVLVETVGVGQSEIAVANMTDTFLVLMLARTGDSLQGIKKGVLELADVLTVNKADGPHAEEASMAAHELAGVLHLLYPPEAAWTPPVLTCSSTAEVGIDEVWAQVVRHREQMTTSGELTRRRTRQDVQWMWSLVEERLVRDFRGRSDVRALATELEQGLGEGTTTPAIAVRRLLGLASG